MRRRHQSASYSVTANGHHYLNYYQGMLCCLPRRRLPQTDTDRRRQAYLPHRQKQQPLAESSSHLFPSHAPSLAIVPPDALLLHLESCPTSSRLYCSHHICSNNSADAEPSLPTRRDQNSSGDPKLSLRTPRSHRLQEQSISPALDAEARACRSRLLRVGPKLLQDAVLQRTASTVSSQFSRRICWRPQFQRRCDLWKILLDLGGLFIHLQHPAVVPQAERLILQHPVVGRDPDKRHRQRPCTDNPADTACSSGVAV